MDTIPDQIGERLRQAREKAGFEVDDVVFQTRLPRSAIEALEAEDFSRFTSQVYAKSFLSQYSDFLNVEATQWLDALKPSSFIDRDPLLPLLDATGRQSAETDSGVDSRKGWISAMWLLAVSCLFVLGTIKVFEFFEARFGAESGNSPSMRKMENFPVATAPSVPPAAAENPEQEAERSAEEPFKVAPRAIIVK